MNCDNSFESLIRDRVIVANNALKIERLKEYRVSDVMNQGHYEYIDLPLEEDSAIKLNALDESQLVRIKSRYKS